MAFLGAILTGVLLGLLTLTQPARAATPPSSATAEEAALKAALLFNVARFTRWPDQRRERSLCLLGDDPFGETLDQVARLTAERWGDDAPYAIRRLTTPEQATRCAIVFIADSESGRLEGLLRHPALEGSLVASDIVRFVERGGTLGLLRLGNRVRFAVNLTALCRHRLTISAQALELAITVGDLQCR